MNGNFAFINDLFGTMNNNTQHIVAELDKLYWTDAQRYIKRLTYIKQMGYRVLRNGKGKHRVSYKGA